MATARAMLRFAAAVADPFPNLCFLRLIGIDLVLLFLAAVSL